MAINSELKTKQRSVLLRSSYYIGVPCYFRMDLWRIFPSPSVPCLNYGGGDRWCRHLSSPWGISPGTFVLSPVWCSRSRPMIGVLLDPCHGEFHGPRLDYVRQVALATTTTTTCYFKIV
ncbi:uncharacterized protein TNCV_1519031 [Trichonephila clavipes]|nr:uncharacterized protein TNCV_1519031 [Trichonephila clavipes]